MIDYQPLPTLQDAVDALYARINRGRAHSTGTAIVTGLTGRTEDPTPDETAIISDVMGGRWGDRMVEIWSRDDLYAAGASEEVQHARARQPGHERVEQRDAHLIGRRPRGGAARRGQPAALVRTRDDAHVSPRSRGPACRASA